MAKETKSTAVVGIKPLGDRVLLKRADAAEEIKGGIIIPDSAKEKPLEAKVVALGTRKTDKDGKSVAFDVKTDDLVLIGKYAGSEVKIGDTTYIILREEEILAIIG